MKYFKIICYTPFCGEEKTYFEAIKDYTEILYIADDLCGDNANENYYDHVDEYMEEEFHEECFYEIEEISEEEYNRYKGESGI